MNAMHAYPQLESLQSICHKPLHVGEEEDGFGEEHDHVGTEIQAPDAEPGNQPGGDDEVHVLESPPHYHHRFCRDTPRSRASTRRS